MLIDPAFFHFGFQQDFSFLQASFQVPHIFSPFKSIFPIPKLTSPAVFRASSVSLFIEQYSLPCFLFQATFVHQHLDNDMYQAILTFVPLYIFLILFTPLTPLTRASHNLSALACLHCMFLSLSSLFTILSSSTRSSLLNLETFITYPAKGITLQFKAVNRFLP